MARLWNFSLIHENVFCLLVFFSSVCVLSCGVHQHQRWLNLIGDAWRARSVRCLGEWLLCGGVFATHLSIPEVKVVRRTALFNASIIPINNALFNVFNMNFPFFAFFSIFTFMAFCWGVENSLASGRHYVQSGAIHPRRFGGSIRLQSVRCFNRPVSYWTFTSICIYFSFCLGFFRTPHVLLLAAGYCCMLTTKSIRTQ